jgi:hypothetical protein
MTDRKKKRLRCVMLLSDKSSGSSIVQKELSKHPDIHTITHTLHFEKETLYWNKAAAILGLEQVRMRYSELPYSCKKGKKMLFSLLQENCGPCPEFQDDRDMIFRGWRLLCKTHEPVFFEKSPHHLHSWSALSLIHECMKNSPGIDFYFIGLIRNPMDTLYSMWKRWKAVPEKQQFEWLRAYTHLLKFKELVGERLKIITYEDLVSRAGVLRDICSFFHMSGDYGIGKDLHPRSLHKWKEDPGFGFQLDKEVHTFASQFYSDEDLTNKKNRIWTFYRYIHTLSYWLIRCKVKIIAGIRSLLGGLTT